VEEASGDIMTRLAVNGMPVEEEPIAGELEVH